jgi:hypothetical protein
MIKWGPEAPKENRLQGMDFKQLNSRVFDQFCEKAVKYFFLNLAFDICSGPPAALQGGHEGFLNRVQPLRPTRVY